MTVSPLVSKVKLNPAFDKGERLTAAASERDELFSLLLAALPALHTCRRPKPLPCSHSHTHTHVVTPQANRNGPQLKHRCDAHACRG
jgi:hypothetical protein